MTRQHRIERHAINDAAMLAEIAKRLPAVIVNLADNYPDSPGSSTGGSGGHGGSVVEAAVDRRLLDDRAVADWAELERIDRALGPLLRRYLDLTSRWMFARTVGAERHARTPSDDEWCRSCLRIDWFCPRSRGDLCDWCYRYQLAEGEPAPIGLLRARRDGRTITTAMVAAAKAHERRTTKVGRRR